MSQGKQMYYHYLRENIRNIHPKFKELAIQAGAYEDNGVILTGPMDVAKFAELIVKECIKEVEGLQVSDWNQNWNQAIAHTALHLKEHFGVEE